MRRHILDGCSAYSRYWESWLDHSSTSPTPLQDFVGFLMSNPKAFAFTDGCISGLSPDIPSLYPVPRFMDLMLR